MANIYSQVAVTTRCGAVTRQIVDRVVKRDNRTCQMCGTDESDRCPYDGKKITLFVAFRTGLEDCVEFIDSNLRTICSTCAQGLKLIAKRRRPRLALRHIIDNSKGGENIMSNLRAECSNCNEGLQNAAPIKPDRLQLLSQIRRATIDDQKAVLDWMLRKFKLQAIPLD